MLTTLILTAALSHGRFIHYQHDYPNPATCAAAYNIARHQLRDFGAIHIRGSCLTAAPDVTQRFQQKK